MVSNSIRLNGSQRFAFPVNFEQYLADKLLKGNVAILMDKKMLGWAKTMVGGGVTKIFLGPNGIPR